MRTNQPYSFFMMLKAQSAAFYGSICWIGLRQDPLWYLWEQMTETPGECLHINVPRFTDWVFIHSFIDICWADFVGETSNFLYVKANDGWQTRSGLATKQVNNKFTLSCFWIHLKYISLTFNKTCNMEAKFWMLVWNPMNTY